MQRTRRIPRTFSDGHGVVFLLVGRVAVVVLARVGRHAGAPPHRALPAAGPRLVRRLDDDLVALEVLAGANARRAQREVALEQLAHPSIIIYTRTKKSKKTSNEWSVMHAHRI